MLQRGNAHPSCVSCTSRTVRWPTTPLQRGRCATPTGGLYLGHAVRATVVGRQLPPAASIASSRYGAACCQRGGRAGIVRVCWLCGRQRRRPPCLLAVWGGR
eukprot:6831609-Lingulodinium_polyedra.AAC.1